MVLEFGEISCKYTASMLSGSEAKLFVVAAIGAAAVAAGACSMSNETDAGLADATSEAAVDSEAEGAPSAPGDARGPEDAGPSQRDGTVSEAGTADGSDAATVEASPPDGSATQPALLRAGATLSVLGITGDDDVVFYDGASQTYYAEAIDGGPVTTIYTVPPSLNGGYAFAVGDEVFAFGWGNDFVGPLVAWSSKASQPATLTSNGLAFLYQSAWTSDDSRYIGYLQSATSDGKTSALYVANADGTNAVALIPDVDTDVRTPPSCFPRIVFRDDYLVASYCTGEDAGLTPMIRSFSISNGWAPAVVVPGFVDPLTYNVIDRDPFTYPFAVEPDGGRVVAISAANDGGALQVFPIDGGPGSTFDPATSMSPSQSFAGSTSNPWYVFYNDDAGALRQTPVASPSPQVLVDGGIFYFDAISNDGRWMLVSNQVNGLGFYSDVSLVSTVSPGAALLIASSAQSGGLPVAPSPARYGGGGFTADDGYAIVYSDMTQNTQNAWMGHVQSMSVAAPHSMERLSNGYAIGHASLGGSKVLLLDNFQEIDGGAAASTVDLDLVDLSGTTPATRIAAGVPGDTAVSIDRSKIAYTVLQGSAPGIYVSPIP